MNFSYIKKITIYMEINDNNEAVTCRICGDQCKRIYGKHLKFAHNNMTTVEYKNLFPGAPIMALCDREKTTINSGKHMKEERYKKMFSEKIKGNKNPNHKSNTSESDRRSRSPFSKDFIKYDGIENVEEHISTFAKLAIKDRISDTTLQYYLDKGYNEEESIKLLKERQTTFSFEKCIKRYGDSGVDIYTNRQIKWQKSLSENGNMKNGYSGVSQDLFNSMCDKIKGNFRYATNGGELSLKKENGGIWVYDFADVDNKKIIEYQGDFYHANPEKFGADDTPHPFRRNIKSSEIWLNDEKKKNVANENGYEVLYIWDSEFSRVGKENKNKIIDKCIKFLRS
jgi:hypothetical protein